MSTLKEKADYVLALYHKGLAFPAWSKDRTDFHTESFWRFCNWFLPRPLPYKPFHREWMQIATGQQFFCVLAPRDHCLAGDTMVDTPAGRVPIWSLHPGDRVVGLRDGCFSVESVTESRRLPGTHITVSISLKNGWTITATPEHRFLTPAGWRRVSDMKIGDPLALASGKQVEHYSPIDALRFTVTDDVYDIGVTGESAFIANGIVSHNSKSSSFGAGYPLWRLVMDRSATIMLVSSSTAVAELQLRVVRESLETNDAIRQNFGEMVPATPTKWTNTEIIINRPPGTGHPSVVALGVGTAILSRRAKFIIADDIVRDDEVATESQRTRLQSWVTGVLMGVLEAEDQIGFIGTKKHQCLLPDTLVATDGSYRSIKTIQPGDRVVSANNQLQTVSAVGHRPYAGNIYTINLVGNPWAIQATPNHPFFTRRGFVRADEIRADDAIGISFPEDEVSPAPLPAYKESPEFKHDSGAEFNPPWEKEVLDEMLKTKSYAQIARDTGYSKTHVARSAWKFGLSRSHKHSALPADVIFKPEFWRLAGWYMAEGCRSRTGNQRNNPTIVWSVCDDEVKELAALIESVVGRQPNVFVSPDGNHRGRALRTNQQQLFDYYAIFGNGAVNKFIPANVMSLPRALQREFIRGWWAGDGSWSKNTGYRLATSSPSAAAGLQRLLARQGIVALVFATQKHAPVIGPQGKLISQSLHYEVRWSTPAGNGLLNKNHPYHHKRKTSLEIDAGYLWLPVKSIGLSAYNGPVYNLTVDNTHTYLCAGGEVHNSDFYADLESNSLYDYHRYDAIVDTLPDGTWKTLWPEKWPEHRLRERMQLLGTFQFNQNYRNISMAEGDSPFPMRWLEKCRDTNFGLQWQYPYDDLIKVIGVDLALAQGTKGSYFVAIVVGLDIRTHDIFILNMTRNQADFPTQIEIIDRMIADFKPNAVVVESNAYQGAMTSTIAGRHPQTEVVSHYTGRNKNDPNEGIPMMQPMVERGKFHFPYKDQSSQAQSDIIIEELNRLGVARHADCVPAGTLIQVRGGVKAIEDVVVGDEVLTHRGRYRKVTQTGQREAKTFTVASNGLPDLRLTDNHRIYAFDRYEKYVNVAGAKTKKLKTLHSAPRWINIADGIGRNQAVASVVCREIADVDVLDMRPFAASGWTADAHMLYDYFGRPAFPRYLPIDGDFLRLIGYFLAEGTTGHHNTSWASHASEEPMRDWLVGWLNKLGFAPHPIQTSPHGWVVSTSSKILHKFFRTFGKKEAKCMPDWVNLLPPEKQMFIIEGYLLGDGCFTDGKIRSASISPAAAFQIYQMALRNGLAPSLKKHAGQNGHLPQWKLTFTAGDVGYIIDFINPALLSGKQVKRQKRRVLRKTLLYTCDADTNYLTGRIRHIRENPGVEIVYNLEVDEDESYTANGVVVHNCVMALWFAVRYLSKYLAVPYTRGRAAIL